VRSALAAYSLAVLLLAVAALTVLLLAVGLG
jgi:hypothetical protein